MQNNTKTLFSAFSMAANRDLNRFIINNVNITTTNRFTFEIQIKIEVRMGKHRASKKTLF